ncbi:hypothetical protein DFH09DRAFT_1327321 [Mycena vulgaris]|nr:hypothetical protein DFH09DRAFT_1327321 [Mycena vulgaris]
MNSITDTLTLTLQVTVYPEPLSIATLYIPPSLTSTYRAAAPSACAELATPLITRLKVLHDDSSFTSDQLQTLSFYLCHVYTRSNPAISLSAPVYYADKVAGRSRIHYGPKTSGGQVETVSDPESPSSKHGSYTSAYQELHDG